MPSLFDLPPEIRHQIYTYLFTDLTLLLRCTQPPPPPESAPPEATCRRPPRIAVSATAFPTAACLTCRALHRDLVHLRPAPVHTLRIECDMAVTATLREQMKGVLQGTGVRGRGLDAMRARRVVVNQEGVYALNLGVIKLGMPALQGIEVLMPRADVAAEYATEWVWKVLQRGEEGSGATGQLVRPGEGEEGWGSREFAFGWLHSFLGWELPTMERRGREVRLWGRQEVRVWWRRECLACVEALHDIENRRVVSVRIVEASSGWRECFGHLEGTSQPNLKKTTAFFGKGHTSPEIPLETNLVTIP